MPRVDSGERAAVPPVSSEIVDVGQLRPRCGRLLAALCPPGTLLGPCLVDRFGARHERLLVPSDLGWIVVTDRGRWSLGVQPPIPAEPIVRLAGTGRTRRPITAVEWQIGLRSGLSVARSAEELSALRDFFGGRARRSPPQLSEGAPAERS